MDTIRKFLAALLTGALLSPAAQPKPAELKCRVSLVGKPDGSIMPGWYVYVVDESNSVSLYGIFPVDRQDRAMKACAVWMHKRAKEIAPSQGK